jgi:hypothetical protein
MPFEADIKNAIRRGHEGNDIREGWVMFTAVALAVTVPLIMVLIWFQYKSLAGVRYNGLTPPVIQASQSKPTKVFPEPRLQTISGQQRREFQAKEETELNSYGWVDGTHQFVRIPISRAMEIIAARGLPVRGTNVNSIGPSELDLVKQRSQDKHLAPMKEAK